MDKNATIEVPRNFPEMLRAEEDKILDGARKLLDLPVGQPIETRHALILSTSFGYDVTPMLLVRLLDSGKLPFPERFGVELAWQNSDIAKLLLCLDEQRRWMPGFHTARKTKDELAEDERESSKGLAMIEYLKTLTADELFVRLDQAADTTLQMLIRSAIREKLATKSEVA